MELYELNRISGDDGRVQVRTNRKVGLGLLVSGLIASMATAVVTAGATQASAQPASGPSTTVTLITGDRVTVDGARTMIHPGKDRPNVTFQTFTENDHRYVVPSDARALVQAGKLDRRLFDLTTLIDAGYDDQHRDTLPLIVTHPEAKATPKVATAKVTANLPSINGQAVSMTKSADSWEALTNGAAARTTTTSGVSAIWLDGRRETTLAESVPQIGAPQAWDSGFTGEGVTVAVLDTGVDQTHPDLAGQEIAEANFGNSGTNVDHFGHGTHVASTIAGTGAASDGTYTGVAPNAAILDGKVFDDDGFASESAIIAGMQWAAEQDADIVNLSLGGPDTPEIDPVEQAVNELTAEHDTLFVVAAGNNGAPESIGSPASADSALAVGAVDKSDQLARFSSRGPRNGDGAIKPDITAPGVAIAAAKAEHGILGDPVADGYVAMDGTSMAAPHVAGAAALVKQARPELTGRALKATLTGSAAPNPDLTPFEQGTGRVSVPDALNTTVLAQPTSLSFGVAEWPHDDNEPITKTITYTNPSEQPLTLSLSLSDTEVFSLAATEVTVPAGGKSTVDVTADTRAGENGAHSATVVASAGESTIRTPLSVVKESEHYTVTLRFTDEAGSPTDAAEAILYGQDTYTWESGTPTDGTLRLRLPKDTYHVESTITGAEHDHWLVQPALVVDGNMDVTVDARTTEPIDISTPGPSESIGGAVGYSISMPGRDYPYSSNRQFDDLDRASVALLGDVPADWAVRGGVEGEWLGDDDAYYRFAWFPDEFPAGFTRTVTRDELATVKIDVGRRNDAGGPNRLMTFAFPTEEDAPFLSAGNGVSVPAPGVSTLHTNTEDVEWDSYLELQRPDEYYPAMTFALGGGAYQAGKTYREVANHAVFGPALPAGFPVPYRSGDVINVWLAQFADSSGHFTRYLFNYESGSMTLHRDGEQIAESDDPVAATFAVPAEQGDYRLAVTTNRADRYSVSTKVSSEWTFTSSHVDDPDGEPLPFNVIRFKPRLDRENSAPAGRKFRVPVVMQNETGAYERPRNLAVEASYDEGKTWQRVKVAGGKFAKLTHPADAASVSLRATAADADGNTVKQTIIKAYLLR